MFRKVLKSLQKFFGKNLKGHKRRRLKKLAALICGLMRSKTPSMIAIGSGLPQRIKAYSKEKEAKKFLENRFIDLETYYQPYIKEIVQEIIFLFPHKEDITLVIDGSKMGKDHMCLMVSIVFRGRGLPIYWIVKKKPKGHFKGKVHVKLVKEVHDFLSPIIPTSKSVCLLGDGEFDSINLQKFCLSKGWNYVFRTACNTMLYENESEFQAKDLEVNKKQKFISFPDVEFTKKKMKNVHFVLWHDPKYDDPIPLVSNLSEPIDIIQAYDKRYSIECLFKDMKSTTFNIHKTRAKDIHAISNLIMLAAFAIILFTKIALKYENSPHREFIHRIRDDQKINSFITFARDFIKYCLEEGIAFCFSFQFSKNSS